MEKEYTNYNKNRRPITEYKDVNQDVVVPEKEKVNQDVVVPEKEPVKTKLYTIANCTKLNFRDEPNGNILSIIGTDDTFEIVSIDGDWANITFKSIVGYVMKEYIKEK